MEFKDRMKMARKLAGINQEELASIVGITQASVSDMETGKSSASSYTARLANACGVDALWLEAGIGDMYRGKQEKATDKTLRDYFAAKAMQGMLAYPGCEMRGSHHNNNTAEGVAAMAYDYADAMLRMRAAPALA